MEAVRANVALRTPWLTLNVGQKDMASIALSDRTQERLERVFPIEMQSEARNILLEVTRGYADYFGESGSFERFHIAALKVSRGDLKELRTAADLMHLDYRDLLVSAGFANDIEAHLKWLPGKK